MFTHIPLPKRSLVLAIFLLLHLPALYAQRPVFDFGNSAIPNKLVYKLKPQSGAQLRKSSGANLSAVLRQVGAKNVVQKFPGAGAPPPNRVARMATPAVDLSLIYELQYGEGHTFEEIKTALMATGEVAYVEPLYLREPLHQPNDPSADSTKTTQFYLKQVQAYGGWEVEQGDTNMVIGILDTGFRLSHQDLKEKVKHNYNDPIDGRDNDGDGLVDNYSGWDFADHDNSVADDSPWKGHGTAVAGVAAGATNNGVGIAGLGYNAKFMPLKVFSSYPGGAFGGYEAIVYAADKGCKVINLSWGGTGFSQFEQDIINYAALVKDVLIVASAGNTNAFLDLYPASYDNVVSVGGSDKQDIKYKDHTYSYNIDLISPSLSIYSTSVAGDAKYVYVGGTSFSAPTVAGGAALVRAHYPELNALQVAERLRAGTDKIYDLEGNKPYLEMLGTGRFNLKKALKAAAPKSVRCTSFGPGANQNLSANSVVTIDARFVNYLSPLSNLDVTLTSLSPYVEVLQDKVQLGSLGTLAEASTGSPSFKIKISKDAPSNYKVYLRLGYADGAYSDFQHFALYINPSFATLNANNLQLTLNSQGNIGYNGLNLGQGVGVTYKGSASLLFEGGLILSADSGKVADNLHNASWQNSKGFEPLALTRKYYDTRLADQEVRTLMQTNASGHPLVEVRTVGYAWADAPNQDYVILEYQLTNRSDETIPLLHAGLFADWDIGNYTENRIGWDEELQMGYAYHAYEEMPYAGIKLLTPENKLIYHAADNMSSNDSTVSIDDGFSNAEKYKVISNGVSRLKAGEEYGSSVSHVLGATATDLAPGQTKTIAFAVLAGDNLQALQEYAQAAQRKYKGIKSGPPPVAAAYQTCRASDVVISPDGGSLFNFYADSTAQHLIASGQSYTLAGAAQNTTVYVANADSLYLSALVPMQVQVVPNAQAQFAEKVHFAQVNKPVTFSDESEHATSWHWNFGDGQSSSEQYPNHTYKKPGSYEVRLTVSNTIACTQSSYAKTIDVYDVAPKLYPNPAAESITLNLTRPVYGSDSTAPVFQLTDLSGKAVAAVPMASTNISVTYDLSQLSAGIYIARITYGGASYVERVLVRR
ncbi:S8 family serine peptidase [Pontibacter mangrovi]|uniref:PKD domain-containing protein n=1 Tax=Pontibacter mangrovi TaxID=2589816 RepID=A0A501W3Y0_9BACT|nr:S8 family serine peptidase [Pontibacter mangrovi]TPE42824.1 PKD domain-containing protein [Pontibacter mangrovi]